MYTTAHCPIEYGWSLVFKIGRGDIEFQTDFGETKQSRSMMLAGRLPVRTLALVTSSSLALHATQHANTYHSALSNRVPKVRCPDSLSRATLLQSQLAVALPYRHCMRSRQTSTASPSQMDGKICANSHQPSTASLNKPDGKISHLTTFQLTELRV